MATAPAGFARAIPGSERPGSTPIYRSVRPPSNPAPDEPGEQFPGLTRPWAESAHHSFVASVKQFAALPCLGARAVVDGSAREFEWLTYAQVGLRAARAASGMHRLELLPEVDGLRLVAVYMKNCVDWVVTEQAAFARRAIVVALYDSLGADSTQFILNQTQLATVVCSAAELRKLTALRAQCPSLRHVVLSGARDAQVESEARAAGLSVFHLVDDVEAEGSKEPLEPPEPPRGQDLATLMYTSGTTGEPKGVEITHAALMASCAASIDLLAGPGGSPFSTDTVYLSFLPLAHIYERSAVACLLASGSRVGFSQGNALKLLEDVAALEPTLLCAVPRLLNRMYDGVITKAAQGSPLKAKLFSFALAAKLRRLRRCGSHEHAWWDRVVFHKLKARLGLARCQVIVSGSAPLSPEVLDFARVAFICRVSEGYGQTETCGGVCTSAFTDIRGGGYVGGPNGGAELKLESVPDLGYLVTDREHGVDRLPCLGRGEICVRGPVVFRGYFKQPGKTQEALDADGWLHTGDIGLWSPLGQLRLVDRRKNLFKLSQGEYVAPEKVELALAMCATVAQVFVSGDSFHSHLVAVVVPDEAALKLFAKANGLAGVSIKELCDHPMVKTHVLKEIADASARANLAGFERVRAVYLHHEPFSVENELLTPTFKLRRADAQRTFQKQLDALYVESGDCVGGRAVLPK